MSDEKREKKETGILIVLTNYNSDTGTQITIPIPKNRGRDHKESVNE